MYGASKALNLDWRIAASTCVCVYDHVQDHRKQKGSIGLWPYHVWAYQVEPKMVQISLFKLFCE